MVRVLARVRRVPVWVGGTRREPVTLARACQLLHAQGASHVLECGQCTQQAWPWLARQPITPRVYIEIDDVI